MIDMKVKLVSKKGDKLEFLLEDATPAFANALRRIMVAEVPTMSISWVDISVNGSALYDEIIASRLGLIPLKFNPKKFSFPQEGDAKSKKPHYDVHFTLDKKGPCTVCSGDMKPSDSSVVPTDPRFPITELLENQAIRLEAYAKLGLGKEHSKNHAAIASYQYFPEMRKAKDGERHERCPPGLVDTSGKKPAIADWTKADIEGGKCMAGDYVVELSESRFIFRVESVCGLSPEDIVLQAAQIIGEKAEGFAKALKDV